MIWGCWGNICLKVFKHDLRGIRGAGEGSNSRLEILLGIWVIFSLFQMFQLFLYEENVCIEMDTGIFIFLRCTFNIALKREWGI